jgi:hypothetical protein
LDPFAPCVRAQIQVSDLRREHQPDQPIGDIGHGPPRLALGSRDKPLEPDPTPDCRCQTLIPPHPVISHLADGAALDWEAALASVSCGSGLLGLLL